MRSVCANSDSRSCARPPCREHESARIDSIKQSTSSTCTRTTTAIVELVKGVLLRSERGDWRRRCCGGGHDLSQTAECAFFVCSERRLQRESDRGKMLYASFLQLSTAFTYARKFLFRQTLLYIRRFLFCASLHFPTPRSLHNTTWRHSVLRSRGARKVATLTQNDSAKYLRLVVARAFLARRCSRFGYVALYFLRTQPRRFRDAMRRQHTTLSRC